jgi:hypothetical protein
MWTTSESICLSVRGPPPDRAYAGMPRSGLPSAIHSLSGTGALSRSVEGVAWHMAQTAAYRPAPVRSPAAEAPWQPAQRGPKMVAWNAAPVSSDVECLTWASMYTVTTGPLFAFVTRSIRSRNGPLLPMGSSVTVRTVLPDGGIVLEPRTATVHPQVHTTFRMRTASSPAFKIP